jgi:hypothetical protein
MKTLEQIIAKSNEVKNLLANNGIELNGNILIKIQSESMQLTLCEDDTLSTRVFGGDMTVNGYRDFETNIRKIELSVGSMGTFTPNCIASTTKVFTQAAILSNWSVFIEIVSALMNKVEAVNKLAMLTSKK